MSGDAAADSNAVEKTDKLVPTEPDGTPILWDGNDATIAGTLERTGKHYRRVGLFQPLLMHRAVTLHNGKKRVSVPLSKAPFLKYMIMPRNIFWQSSTP